MINIEVFSGPEAIHPFRKGWEGLFAAGDYEVSTSFAWTEALLATHLERNDSFHLLIVRDGESLTGIVPLILSRERKHGLLIRELFPLSEYYHTHSDLLLPREAPDLIEPLLDSLRQITPSWDLFRVAHRLLPHPFFDGILPHLKGRSLKYRANNEAPSFYIPLRQDFPSYLKERPSKLQNTLRKNEKKMQRLGRVSLAQARQFESPAKAYEALLAVEERSWKHDQGSAISTIRRQEDFYGMLCESTAGDDSLHLLFLMLNDQPIAYNLGIVKNKTYFYLKTSYADEFKNCGPSTLLRARLIERLIGAGIDRIDFASEPYEWQREWTDAFQRRGSLTIYNATSKGRALFFYHSLRQRLKKAPERLLTRA